MESKDEDKEMMESRPYHMKKDEDEEERLDKSDIVYRTQIFKRSHIDEENRRVRIGVVPKPVERGSR